MYKVVRPLFMICQTPMHVGSGSDLGIVDLPIQREKETGFPKIEASSLKGAIRESFEEKFEEGNKDLNLVFGPIDGDDSYASSIGFSDGRILLFPVKSMKGIYAYVTCPKVLHRLYKELQYVGVKKLFKIPDENTIPNESNLLIEVEGGSYRICLEEYTIEVNKDEDCSSLATWISNKVVPKGEVFDYMREKIKKDIVILSDNDFNDFVNLSTEVITRTRINPETGTVGNGALFTEEFLPSETVMYSLVFTSPIFNEDKGQFEIEDSNCNDKGKKEAEKVMKYFSGNLNRVIQIGGDTTLGKGLTEMVFNEEE